MMYYIEIYCIEWMQEKIKGDAIDPETIVKADELTMEPEGLNIYAEKLFNY